MLENIPDFRNILTHGNSECHAFSCMADAFPLVTDLPVAIVGAGPVGLTTALALAYYGIPFVVFEADAGLSTETKAGTTLTRTLEIWQRFGAAGNVLRQGDAGRRDRRYRALDQPQPRLGEAAPAARRDAFSLRHQPAAARHGAGVARQPGGVRRRDNPLSAPADVVHATPGPGRRSRSIRRTANAHSKPATCSPATAAAAPYASSWASRSKAAHCLSAIRWST